MRDDLLEYEQVIRQLTDRGLHDQRLRLERADASSVVVDYLDELERAKALLAEDVGVEKRMRLLKQAKSAKED